MAKSNNYIIIVKGYISDRLADSLSGMEISSLDNGKTSIRGKVRDQADLYGIINRIRDFGLTLMLVKRD